MNKSIQLKILVPIITRLMSNYLKYRSFLLWKQKCTRTLTKNIFGLDAVLCNILSN